MARKAEAATVAYVFDYTRARITLDGCLDVIRNLARCGNRPASMKLACWFGVMSIQNELAKNGDAARLLSRFVDGRLPEDYEGCHAVIKAARCMFTGTHFHGLMGVQAAADAGTLPEMPQDSWTYDQWREWREAMIEIPGIGRKVASFIGLLLCPETCPLVPVDRWVMRRMGLDGDKSPQSKKGYEAIETAVLHERDRNGHESLPLGAWHWYKWSEARQAAGAETPAERPECHCKLSPRWY